jgi:predicted HTH transcriptional regulator
MPVLNRRLYETLCDSNKTYLRDRNLIADEHGSDIEFNEHPNAIINQLIENEKFTKKGCEERYQKEKNKVKYIIQFLTAALIFLGAGFALAPLLIVSPIALPILPFLLVGFGIIAITKFILSIKINHQETSVRNAKNVLASLGEVERKLSQEELHAQLSKIPNFEGFSLIKEQMQTILEGIVGLRQQHTTYHSEISNLLNRGLFKTIQPEDSANQPVKVDEHTASGPSN